MISWDRNILSLLCVRDTEITMHLIIIGAGQYGEVAKEIADAMGIYDRIDFIDDYSEKAIGKVADISNMNYDQGIVAIGNPEVRKRLTDELGEKLTTLIHPKAVVMPSSKIENGCIVEAGAQICSHAEIGLATFVMSNAVVGHNSKVGNYCQLKYNSTIVDSSAVPDNTKVEYNTVWC